MAGLCLFAFSCKKESTDTKLPFENGVATFTPTGTLNVGLAAYYPFSGNTNDASGNSNHGTAFGSAALTTNRFGEANKAYSFAGTGYVRIANSTTTDITGNFSISLWVKPDTITTDWSSSFLVQRGNASAGADPFTLTYNNGTLNSVISVFSGTGSTANQTAMPGNVRFHNVWTHVVATCNKSTKTMKLYANGLLVSTQTFPDLSIGYSTSGADFYTYLGTADGTHSMFRGSLDEVRIYNKELTAAEALELAHIDD